MIFLFLLPDVEPPMPEVEQPHLEQPEVEPPMHEVEQPHLEQ